MKKLFISKDGIKTLQNPETGEAMVCPFKNVLFLPEQTKFGTTNVKIITQPCNSNCPLFDVNDEFTIVNIRCGFTHSIKVQTEKEKTPFVTPKLQN